MIDLSARLENWANAVRVNEPRKRCRSFEGCYRSGQGDHWEEVVHARAPTVNVQDARLVELAWGGLPMAQRIILKGKHVFHWEQGTIVFEARKMSGLPLRRRYFMRYLGEAENAISVALLRRELENRNIARAEAQKTLAMAFSWAYATRTI